MPVSIEKLSNIERISFLTRDSVLYGIASAIHKIFAIVTLPILTRYFSIDEYGVIDLYVLISGLIVTMFVFGQDSAVARFFYDNKDKTLRRQMISESLIFQLTVLLLFIPLIWVYSEPISRLIYDSTNSTQIFKIVIAQIPFMLLVNFSTNLLKWTFSRGKFLIISLGFAVVNMTLLILAVLIFNIGITSVFYISLITYFIFGLLGVFFIREWIIFPRKIMHFKEVFIYAAPHGVVSIMEMLVPTMSRWLVSVFIGPESLGIYAVGARVASIMSLYISSFKTAWGPFSLSIYKQENSVNTYNLVLKLFSWVVGFILLLLLFFSEWIVLLISNNTYINSTIIIFPLALGLAIQSIESIMGIGISISKKSYLIIFGYISFILLILVSSYIFSPISGVFGVAIFVMFGYTIKSFTCIFLSKRVHDIGWRYGSTIYLFVLISTLGFFEIWLREFTDQNEIYIVDFFIISIYSVLSWNLLFYDNEKQGVKSKVKSLYKYFIK